MCERATGNTGATWINEAKQSLKLTCVTFHSKDESQFSIVPSARYWFFKLQPWIWMAEWTSKQMTGDVNSFIYVSKSPEIEDGGSQTARQQQRRKGIRFMSHTCHRATEQRNHSKISQGKILDHRLCHLSLSTYCLSLSFSLSCTLKENTDISVTSPRRASEWSLDTEIWGSKSTGHPCVSDKKTWVAIC